jgi:hypothetical protein
LSGFILGRLYAELAELANEWLSKFNGQIFCLTKIWKLVFFIYVQTFHILEQGNYLAVFPADTVGSFQNCCN